MEAAVYLRQSLDRDGNRLAVERQREDCLGVCAERRWTPVIYEDNDTSASSGKVRPAYERMLADIAAGKVQAVVAWDLDRLHRRPVELEHFIDLADRHGVALATVGGETDLSTDGGRLFARIKGAVARAEIERKSARQRRASDQRAQSGRPPAGGRRAFGFGPDGTSTHEDEAPAIEAGYRDLLAGASLRSIAARWNTAGLTTAAGRPWRPDAVRYVLLNPRNAALRVHRGEIIGPGAWPAIVSEETFRAAVRMLTDPARRTTPTTARKYLLAGLARCHCGAPVITGRTQHGQRTYRCGAQRGHLSRAAEPIDDLVEGLVVTRLEQPDAADFLHADRHHVDVGALRDAAQTLRARLSELADLFADGVITGGQLTRGTERTRAALDAAEEQLADAGRIDVLVPLIGVDDVFDAWQAYDIDRQRAVVDTLLDIELLPPGRGSRIFDPATVRTTWKVT